MQISDTACLSSDGSNKIEERRVRNKRIFYDLRSRIEADQWVTIE